MVVAVAVVAGLVLGSFANVVIHRVPRGESVVRPASRCAGCGTAVAPRDNIPIFSWVLLRGRCRHCGVPISARYPVVEALTAALFGATAGLVDRPTDLIALLPLVWVLVVLSAIDLEHQRLPNVIVLPSVAVGAVLLAIAAAVGPGLGAWTRALGAGGSAFAGMFVLALISPRGMGMGDVKLAAVLGMALGYFGWGWVFVGFFLSFAIGAVGGLALVAARRAGLKSQVPFGPYLAVGTLLTLWWGDPLVGRWLGT